MNKSPNFEKNLNKVQTLHNKHSQYLKSTLNTCKHEFIRIITLLGHSNNKERQLVVTC